MSRPFIQIGPKDCYFDAESALAASVNPVGVKQLPVGYRLFLSDTFKQATCEGQIDSLFRDAKTYGYTAIKAKLAYYVIYVETVARYRKFLDFNRHNLSPLDPPTFRNSRTNNTYFKFWVLMKIAQLLELPTTASPNDPADTNNQP